MNILSRKITLFTLFLLLSSAPSAQAMWRLFGFSQKKETGELTSADKELFQAIDTHDITRAEKALQAGAHIEALFTYEQSDLSKVLYGNLEEGITPLMRAAFLNDYDMAKFLLKNKAQVNTQTAKTKRTPLLLAIQSPYKEKASLTHEKLITLLLENHADVNAIASTYCRETPLISAIKRESPTLAKIIVKKLITWGANVNTTASCDSPLAILVDPNAINYHNKELLQLLLESGANPNSIYRHHETFVQYIIKYGFGDPESTLFALNELIKYGANLKVKDTDGNTLLHLAAERGNPITTRFLLEHAADREARNNYGETPADVAKSKLRGPSYLIDREAMEQVYGMLIKEKLMERRKEYLEYWNNLLNIKK